MVDYNLNCGVINVGFLDDIRKQTKQFSGQYTKLSFPSDGDVDEQIVSKGVSDAISALEIEYKLHVMEGRKNVRSRMLGHYYSIWMNLSIGLGYYNNRNPLPLTIRNNKNCNSLNCSNYQPVGAFLKELDSGLKKEFSNIKYSYDVGNGRNLSGDYIGRERITTGNVNKVINDMYYELKRQWREKEIEWKKNPKVEFFVADNIHIITELKCDKDGVVL